MLLHTFRLLDKRFFERSSSLFHFHGVFYDNHMFFDRRFHVIAFDFKGLFASCLLVSLFQTDTVNKFMYISNIQLIVGASLIPFCWWVPLGVILP